MVYDCFSFFNELDLLEIRLNTLAPVVDRFVLVEATKTHSNKDKPLYFLENKERFSAFQEKLIHVIVDEYPDFTSSWVYENHQRNMILSALCSCKSDDIIIISDLDEIPKPEVIKRYPGKGIYMLEQDSYSCFINYKSIIGIHWYGSKIMSYGDIVGNEIEKYAYRYNEYLVEGINDGSTPTKIRLAEGLPVLRDGGWHFTYLGGVEKIRYKLESFAHQEFNNPEYTIEEDIRRKLEKGIDFFNPKDDRCRPVTIGPRFPAYVRDNRDKYKHLIYDTDRTVLLRSWLIVVTTLLKYWLWRKPVKGARKWIRRLIK